MDCEDNMPKCPFCGQITKYGERDSFSLSFGETPIVCPTHGEVGYRDHNYGDFVVYKKLRATYAPYWGRLTFHCGHSLMAKQHVANVQTVGSVPTARSTTQ